MYELLYIGFRWIFRSLCLERAKKMNQTQKSAVYGLILTACMLFIPLFDFIETRIGLSTVVKHILLFIWLVLLITPVWLIERKKTKAPFDERDKQICIRASITAFLILFLVSTITYTVIIFGFESLTLTTAHLPALIYGSLSAFIFLLSITVLIQYIPFKNNQKERE